MLYKVEYSEVITYCELYEAKSAKEAYKQFYEELLDDDIEPQEVVMDDLIIEPIINETNMQHKAVRG